VGGEFYLGKLAWLGELRSYLDRTAKPTDPVAVCGDFNIAPEDRDVYDRAALEGSTHITEPERQALGEIEAWGLVDAFRLLYDQGQLFSWWDYRAGNFHKHLGMRIDLILLSKALAETASYALIDRNARKGKQPSDHAPVLVDVTP
jgi:exodeoxyribonuclease-3